MLGTRHVWLFKASAEQYGAAAANAIVVPESPCCQISPVSTSCSSPGAGDT